MYGFLLVFFSNFVRQMHLFWDIRLVISLYSDLETRVRVTQGHRKWYHSIRHPWLPINFHSNTGLSRTVFEINGDFSRRWCIAIHVYLTPRWMGSPWNWVSSQWFKKLQWWRYQWRGRIPAITSSCSVLPPEIVMHDDAYIGGRSGNNVKCVVHDDLGRKNQTTRYNSAVSLALGVIFSVSKLWNLFGSFTEPLLFTTDK